ncbi:MAG: rhodanese-like domain-containing protein [Verrucomicrobiae bacterium]|nr:rhodanese-like domain-containing protein [Verrucomicrobiae bacterium]
MKNAVFEIFRKDVLALGLLATGALCVGLLINQLRDKPLSLVYASKQQRIDSAVARLGTQSQMQLDGVSGPEIIFMEDFVAFTKRKDSIIFDARPEIFHRLGHVPGAYSLSRDEFEKDYQRQRSFIEANRDKTLVVYCADSSCDDGEMVAKALCKMGYRKVLLFKGGWDEWTQKKMPEEKA